MEVEYGAKALGRDVALSYALTVHKSQGSEYPVVVLPVLHPLCSPSYHPWGSEYPVVVLPVCYRSPGLDFVGLPYPNLALALARCCRSTGACSTATCSTRAYRARSNSSSSSAPKRFG